MPQRVISEQKGRYTDEDILKLLMTGLVYPAVLGTVIYGSLDEVIHAFRSAKGALAGHIAPVDAGLATKLIILFTVVAFYCCDYMYLLFTRNYRRRFFLFDCIFIITLYVSVYSLGLQRRATPDLQTITICFIVFIGLYLAWDISERGQLQNMPDELTLYNRIIKWECVTLVAFVITYGLVLAIASWLIASIILIGVLLASTVQFARLTWQKRLYWYKS